jgi:hypothetical protein
MMEDVPTAADAAPVQAVDDAQMTLNGQRAKLDAAAQIMGHGAESKDIGQCFFGAWFSLWVYYPSSQ